MSIGIGTLRAPRQALWPSVVVALLVLMTLALITTTAGRTTDRPNAPLEGRHLIANTPSEISGGVTEGIARGTEANTPSELWGGEFRSGRTTRRDFHTRIELGTTTPTEISGGIAGGFSSEIYDRHQRG